jgi:hypothetical protein
MNEKIRELAIQSGLYNTFDFEKFAKLIIKECGLIADVEADGRGTTYPSAVMRECFGIKE